MSFLPSIETGYLCHAISACRIVDVIDVITAPAVRYRASTNDRLHSVADILSTLMYRFSE